jgi:hypothetical protein
VQVRLFFPTTEAPSRAEEHGPESPSGVVPVAPAANGPWIDEDDDGRQGSM